MNKPIHDEKQCFAWNDIQIPLIITDFDGKIVHVNNIFTEEFGYTSNEFSTYRDILSLLPDNSIINSLNHLMDIAQQVGTFNSTIIFKGRSKKDVQIRFLIDSRLLYIFFFDKINFELKQPKVLTDTQGSSNEINDLKAEIRSLKQIIQQRDEYIKRLFISEKYYRQIVDAANVVIVRFDKNFHLTDFEGSAEKVFGFRKQEILGKSLFETIVPPFESSGRDLTAMMDYILSDIRMFKYNINENVTKTGTRIWMQWYNSQINDESGELIAILSIGIDITDKITADEALRTSEERFRTLSDLTFEGIMIHDQGIILDVNLSLEKQVGYTREELVGKNLLDLLIPPEYHKEMSASFRKDIQHYESIARHKNGTLIPIAIEGKSIDLNGKKVRAVAVRDISELKKTINELRASEEQLSVIFDSAPVIMLLVNGEREVIRINEMGKKSLLVKDPAQGKIKFRCASHSSCGNCYVNKSDEDCILNKVIDETFSNNKNCFKVEGTMSLNKKGGKEIRFYQVSSILIESLNPKTILITMDDITERRIMLHKLDQHQHHLEELVVERTQEIEKKSKELITQNKLLEFERNQLRTLIDNIPDLIYIKDKYSRFVNANKQLVRIMGAKRLEDIIGKTDFDFFPKKLAQEFFDDEKHILKTGKPIIEKEEPGLDKDKKPIYVLTTKVPLTDRDGNKKYIVGIGRDITEKKNVENKLKEQADNLKKINKLLEARTAKIQQLNEELLSSNDKLESANGELIEQKEELLVTLEKLKLTQTQLIQSEKLASLGILSSGIAHEINNPVNFVYAGVNSVMKDMEDIVPVVNELKLLNSNSNDLISVVDKIEKLKQHYEFDEAFEAISATLQDIKLGATRIIEIVAGLSKYSRSSRDEWQFSEIHEEIESVLVLLKNKYKNRIEIIKNYGRNIPLIECSPGKLNQAFMNILNNAIDSIEQKGQIVITSKYFKNKLSISIRDSGKGMSDKDRVRIFDPFFTTKEVGKGVGLGLYITYSIIEDHKGTIHVNSAEGAGTEFIITLPVNREKEK